MSGNYDASDIEVLSGLDPVRKRPGMYTDVTRPNHIVQEIVDNSVDEAISGYADKISLTLHEDGAISVSDNGRGIPVDQHPQKNIPAIELIFTKLHAGGKFSDKNYQFSGGLHGVGASVVNALSAKLDIRVKRGGKEYGMSFVSGKVVDKLRTLGDVGKRNTGTCIKFWPDPQYFDTTDVAVRPLKNILQAKAILCSGLQVEFIDEMSKEDIKWVYSDGLQAYLSGQLAGQPLLPAEPLVINVGDKNGSVDCAVCWSAGEGRSITESYVNLVPTVQGGTHVNGLRQGVLEAVREFCNSRNLLPRGVKLVADDVWEYCNYILSLRLKDPQFSGQTKERLLSRKTAVFTAAVVKDSFSQWLYQHVETGQRLAELVIDCAQARLKAAKKSVRKRLNTGPALPGKLTDCLSRDMTAELFLVEGDSAGGSAKQARDRQFQAVMPLRGKILNTWEVESSQVLSSKEVHDIAVAIGVDPGSDNLSALRYGKICVLADADSDGAHIAALLCGLFMKHFQPLVEQGHIYIAMPPLYRIDAGKKVLYALDESEKQYILEQIEAERKPGKVSVQRFKGLGEMNPLQLRETTMAPDTRRLVKLTLTDFSETKNTMDMLLSKNRVNDRKYWLESKGNLAVI